MSEASDTPLYERIYAIVRQVPPGKVVTYGQVGERVGCSARTVGFAMASLRSGTPPGVPWQRVINRQGKISIHDPFGKYQQRLLLEGEGVFFDAQDRVDFREFGWLGAPE